MTRGANDRTICPGLSDALFAMIPANGDPVLLGTLVQRTTALVTCAAASEYYHVKATGKPRGTGEELSIDERIEKGREFLVVDRLRSKRDRGVVQIVGKGLGAKVSRVVSGPAPSRIVALEDIRIDGGTQPREEIDESTVKEYTEAIQANAPVPPGEAVFDGRHYWLWDGFHRYHAHRKAGRNLMHLRVTDGTAEDARWLSCSANQGHGLKRKEPDKKRAVLQALGHPRAASMTNTDIARHCGVDHSYVSRIRDELALSFDSQKIAPPPDAPKTVRRGGKAYTMNTGRIGKTRRQRATPAPADQSSPASPEGLEQNMGRISPREVQEAEKRVAPMDAIDRQNGDVTPLQSAELEFLLTVEAAIEAGCAADALVMIRQRLRWLRSA